jgi:transmembrane sensor
MEHVAQWELVGFRLSFSRAVLATLAVAVLAITGTVYWLHSDVTTTGIGEFRTLALEDGTRVHMNADTRLIVRYGKALRQVQLVSGEALFEVTHNPERPFIVTVNGHRIRDIGTEFDVLSERNRLAVTLLQGKVTVSSVTGGAVSSPRPSLPVGTLSVRRQAIMLSPGERLTFTADQMPQIDRPSLDLVTAWERGQVVLDDTPLAEAVAEMNRYSSRRIVISSTMHSIRVSGVFEAGDSASFAAAVAREYDLNESTRSGGDIVLSSAEQSGR